MSGGNGAPRGSGAEDKSEKKPFFKSGFYDSSDVARAAETAYDDAMDEAELKRRRRRDWIFILIGVPALIGIMYLIVMISK